MTRKTAPPKTTPSKTADAPPDPPSPNLAPRQLLKDRAYLEIKDLIQTGALPPGTFLSERQLSEQLGMSKTPIRAALEHLEAQGLVAVSPQQGIVVRDLLVHEIIDLFDLRLALEPFVARRLAGRGGERDPQRLRENLAAQSVAADAGDAVAATALDVEFHLLLAQRLENREIARILRQAYDKLYRSILRITRLGPGRLVDSAAEHRAIVDAIAAGQEDLAQERMEEHLRFGKRFLLSG